MTTANRNHLTIARIIKRTLLVILALLVVGVIGFFVWANLAMGPMAEAQPALQSDAQVQVTTERWLEFTPLKRTPTTGLIIYPAARVNPRSYAPAAHTIAAGGYEVIIVPMPSNFALFAPNRAADVIAAFPQIEHWVVGGHSLGGAMAARFARINSALLDGMVLWAAYPGGNDDLSATDLAVSVIYGSADALTPPQDVDAVRQLLPADTRYVLIEGGNHAQFGWYGDQGGDNPASISRDDQQAQIIQATLDLLELVDSRR